MEKIITIVRVIAMLADEVSQWVRGTTVIPDEAKALALRAELMRMGIAVARAGQSVDEAIERTKKMDPNPLNATIYREPGTFDAAVSEFRERQIDCVEAGNHSDTEHCEICKGK